MPRSKGSLPDPLFHGELGRGERLAAVLDNEDLNKDLFRVKNSFKLLNIGIHC